MMVSYFATQRRGARASGPYHAPYSRRMPSATSGAELDSSLNQQENGDVQPPVVRKRIAVACGRCRKRKIRCSGDPGNGNPCQNCKHAGAEVCQFLRVASQMTDWNIAGASPSEFSYNIETARAFQLPQPSPMYGAQTTYGPTSSNLTLGSDYMMASPMTNGTHAADHALTLASLPSYGYPSARPYYPTSLDPGPAMYADGPVDMSLYGQTYAHPSPVQTHGAYMMPMRSAGVAARSPIGPSAGSPYFTHQAAPVSSYAYTGSAGPSAAAHQASFTSDLTLTPVLASQHHMPPSPALSSPHDEVDYQLVTSNTWYPGPPPSRRNSLGSCSESAVMSSCTTAMAHMLPNPQPTPPLYQSPLRCSNGSSVSTGSITSIVSTASRQLRRCRRSSSSSSGSDITIKSSSSSKSPHGFFGTGLANTTTATLASTPATTISHIAHSTTPPTYLPAVVCPPYALPRYHDFAIAGGLVVDGHHPFNNVNNVLRDAA